MKRQRRMVPLSVNARPPTSRESSHDYTAIGLSSRLQTPRIAPFFSALLVVMALASCGGGTGPMPASTGESLVTFSGVPGTWNWEGHFVGKVSIDGVDRYADAVLTIDGMVRIYLGSAYAMSGALQTSRTAKSAQFVGSLKVLSDGALGSGAVITQGCAVARLFPMCNETALGVIRLAAFGKLSEEEVRGEIQVTTDRGVESWPLTLQPWGYFVGPARIENLAGQYREKLAAFALDEDTVVNVDHFGRLFFQSARSGCTGNGTLTPHLDGAKSVYDVALTVASCLTPYAHLNGVFSGLAATSSGSKWDYDTWLHVWVARPDVGASQVSMTMLGEML